MHRDRKAVAANDEFRLAVSDFEKADIRDRAALDAVRRLGVRLTAVELQAEYLELAQRYAAGRQLEPWYGETIEERAAAFAEAQEMALEEVMAIPFGIMQSAQGIRTNVENYAPFYNIRVSNVWLEE